MILISCLVFTLSFCKNNLHPILSYNRSFQIDYDVKELLGQGGFGVVYHAVNKLDGRKCAIKIIKLDR